MGDKRKKKKHTRDHSPNPESSVSPVRKSKKKKVDKSDKKGKKKSLINQPKKFQVIHPPLPPHPKVVQVVWNQKWIRKLLYARKHQEAKPPDKTRKKRNVKSQINLVHQMMKQRRKFQRRRRNSPVVMVAVMQQMQSKPLPYLLKNSTK